MLAALLLVAAAPAAVPADPVSIPQDEPTAGIDGRFLLPDGTPAAGAEWELRGFGANAARRREFGMPDDWQDLSGQLDEEGRLSVRFDSPQAFQFVLEVTVEDHVKPRYRWGRIETTEIKALGDVAIRPAGKVTGRIVDEEGRPLTGTEWRIHGDEAKRWDGSPVHPAASITTADPETGAFTIGGLPAGPAELKIYDRLFGWSKEHRVLVEAGETVTKDIVLDEVAEFEDRIVLTIFQGRYHSAPEPRPGHMWLVSEDGERRNAQRLEGSSQSWFFDEVGDGTYRVEIDDPWYDAWSEEGVRRRTDVRADLRGSAAIRLDVRDDIGEPVYTYRVDIKFENAMFHPNTFRAASGDAPLADGLVDHLVPHDYSLEIAAGDLRARVNVPGLGAGEIRDVEVKLTSVEEVVGRVLHPDGEPAADVLVRLVEPAKVDDSPSALIWDANTWGTRTERARQERKKAKTDATGRFILGVDVPGRYLVIAGDPGAPTTECAVFDTTDSGPPTDLELTLERGGYVNCEVVFPAGLDPKGRRIIYQPAPGQPDFMSIWAESILLDADGRCRLGPLVPGAFDLRIMPAGHGGWSSMSGVALGKIDVVGGQTIEVSLDYPGGPPGQLSFDLTPNELGEASVSVVAVSKSASWTAASASGAAPRLGPLVLEPDTYTLWFSGDDWLARVSDVTLKSKETRTDVVDLDRWRRRVRFVRGDTPLAKATIQFMNVPDEVGAPEIVTDAHGYAELHLGTGRYSFSIMTGDRELMFLQAAVEWPLGEGVDDIEFR